MVSHRSRADAPGTGGTTLLQDTGRGGRSAQKARPGPWEGGGYAKARSAALSASFACLKVARKAR